MDTFGADAPVSAPVAPASEGSHRMTTQPPFGGDDTTTSYSPTPSQRPRWHVEQSWSTPQPQPPDRWFDPSPPYQAPPPVQPVDRGGGRRTVAFAGALILVSGMSAV